MNHHDILFFFVFRGLVTGMDIVTELDGSEKILENLDTPLEYQEMPHVSLGFIKLDIPMQEYTNMLSFIC